jgi:hypothetical protein
LRSAWRALTHLHKPDGDTAPALPEGFVVETKSEDWS